LATRRRRNSTCSGVSIGGVSIVIATSFLTAVNVSPVCVASSQGPPSTRPTMRFGAPGVPPKFSATAAAPANLNARIDEAGHHAGLASGERPHERLEFLRRAGERSLFGPFLSEAIRAPQRVVFGVGSGLYRQLAEDGFDFAARQQTAG